jgi:hypothetical protein
MAPRNDNQNNELDVLRERIIQLEAEAQIRAQREHTTNRDSDNDGNRQGRAITPANSAFGGTNFQPSGFAALAAFVPYGEDQNAANPKYDKKARPSGVNPGVFKGDKEEFDKWVIKLADKLEEDNETYKRERSRMALVNSLTEGNANNLLEGRYQSAEMPFRSVAEMVATLAAVYHDDNQGSKAREELRKLRYDMADKTMDIHQFIGKINSLADRANIPRSDRKTILYEHIPAYLNPQLLGDSKDPSLSYETFANKVADSALAQHRAYEERRERKQERREREPVVERKTTKKVLFSTAAAATAPKTGKLDNKKKEELMSGGKCFICEKEGHLARNCPIKKTMAKVIAASEEEEEEKASSSDSSSSDESLN